MMGICKPIVVAVGLRYDHWQMIRDEFPFGQIRSCCLDVRRAFNKEWDEDTNGTGFDRYVRERFKAKPTWQVVWEVAIIILNKFGLLIVVCNHGKHRSLSLAREVQLHMNCDLVAIRTPENPFRLRNVLDFMEDIRPPLKEYVHAFGEQPYPISGIWLCTHAFDGNRWSQQMDQGSQRNCISKYLIMAEGDVVVSIVKGAVQARGWFFGIVISAESGQRDEGWFPPSFVSQLPKRFYHGEYDPLRDLIAAPIYEP